MTSLGLAKALAGTVSALDMRTLPADPDEVDIVRIAAMRAAPERGRTALLAAAAAFRDAHHAVAP
jgi:hypothetical protein